MKGILISHFPKLANDPNFKITSKKDVNYNCIAWAQIYDNRWVWPPCGNTLLDGVSCWPKDLPDNETLSSFIQLFEKTGYKVCESSKYEQNYRKIALYINEHDKVTHAARQRKGGLWTSKLGQLHDISHSTPESIENAAYGKVACIMKKSFE